MKIKETQVFSHKVLLILIPTRWTRVKCACRILLPDLSYNGDVCIEFFFNMFGFHIGQLEIFTRDNGNGFNDQQRWTMVGPQGRQWRQQRTTINNLQRGQQVRIMQIKQFIESYISTKNHSFLKPNKYSTRYWNIALPLTFKIFLTGWLQGSKRRRIFWRHCYRQHSNSAWCLLIRP